MPPDQLQRDRGGVSVVGLLRRGCWAAVPVGTIESLIAGGRVVDFPAGRTVYAEADSERLAVVQAVTNGSVFFFDIGRVKRAARNDATLAWALAEESVHRLYDILEELAGNTFASVRQRVARHLLDLATSRLDASRTLTAVVNQQDLANSVGSVREVVARALAELRSEHLVRTSPGRVEIFDPLRMSHELWSRGRDESHSV
jgi:CRP-like cAMP-binding protein